jgi:dehydrodolichyl diphosphate syntase complex subunit NUS1
MLQLVSRETGKPTIAAVADSLLRNAAHRSPRKAEEEVGEFGVSISDLEATLEGNGKQLCRVWPELTTTSNPGERGYMAPDLTIVHHVTAPRRQSPPLELYSFPPWQLRLTEI